MTLYEGLYYPGSELQLVHGDTIGFLGGSALCLWNLSSLTKDYIMSDRRGFQAVACNHKQNLIALAEYGKSPSILIHHKVKESQWRIEGLVALEVDKLVISNEGRYLMVVGGTPDNCILLYNLEKREALRNSDSRVEVKHSETTWLLDAKFNPANSNQFFLLYNNELSTYSIEVDYLVAEDATVQEIYRIQKQKQYKVGEFQFACWDEMNNIYLLKPDYLEYLDGSKLTSISTYPLKSPAKCLVLTQRHVIVFYLDGRIEWLNKYYEDFVKDSNPQLRPLVLDHTFKIAPHVSSATYNHSFSKIFVSHSNAQLTILKLEAEKSLLNEDDQEKNEGQSKQKEKRIVELQIETQILGPFHRQAVTMVKELTSAPIVVSAARDGSVIFWSLTNKQIITTVDLGVSVTCGDINKDENVLCVGTDNGIILLFEISDQFKLNLIYEFRLYDKDQVSEVAFSPVSDELAVCSHGNKNVFFVLTNTNAKFQVLGYAVLPYEATGMTWNTSNKQVVGKDYPQLFVLVGFAILGLTAPDAKAHHRRGDHLRLECEITARKTDPDMSSLVVLGSGELLVAGKDKVLKKYKQPEESIIKIDWKTKAANTPPIEEIEGHDLPITYMSFSARSNELVTGSLDGSFIVRSGDILNQVKNKIQTHNMMSKGVSILLASNLGRRVITAGNDGSLFVWALDKINLTTGYVKKEQSHRGIHKHIESKKDALEAYHVIIDKEYVESVREQVTKKKKQQLVKIDNLKKELKKLLDENDKDDELERLDRDEFAIDTDIRDSILKDGLLKCEEMRKLSLRNNLKREIMANRIKQKTWNKMEVQLKAINGLKANYLVYNYQVRKRLPGEERNVTLVLELRRQNLREYKYRKDKAVKEIVDLDLYKNKSIVNGGYPAVLVYVDYEKVEEKKDEKVKKKKDEQEDKQAAGQQLQVQTDEEWSLLYNSMELFSNNAKRNQIIMIKNIIFKIKGCFNKEFDKMMHFRQQQVEIINEKNKRIAEIYEDLKRPADLTQCKKNILENPDKVLSVDPNELGFKRYLSRDERARLEQERLKEEERLRLLAQDDAGQRALNKMMSGTLQEKKESVLEVVIEREKWMDKPPEEMSEDEKMKLKEYEVKKQKAEEEKERTIKKLEAEYRKLRQQIEEILDKFDDKLFVLFRRKLQYDYRIEEQELYAAKLAVSMLTVSEAERKKKLLELERDHKAEQKNRLTNAVMHVKEYSAELSKMRDQKKAGLDTKRPGEAEGRIKNVEKNVFEDLKTNEKKRKQLQSKWLAKDPNLKHVIVPLDPYVQLEEKLLYAHREKDFATFVDEIRIMQQNYEGNEQALMNALQTRFNLRKDQADLQKRSKLALDYANSLQEKQAKLKQEETEIAAEISEYGAFLESAQSNIEVQFRLKQGCIEISQDKPIPNLGEALLIPRAAIEDRNAKIIQNADEKIKVMENIKTCKIDVTEETLNLQKKLSLANELQQKIKEVQMLKVKKEMQTALAKKDVKMNETELKNLTEQIENLKKQADKRIAVFQNKIDKINSDIEFIRKENNQLQVQKWNLETTVKQRQKIQQMNSQAGSSINESKEKFEQISTNRKLFDKAKKQTEEIELLREELSKLKAKTFANFSNIQR